MKPVLTLSDGLVESKERIRTKAKAVARIEELVVSETAGRTCRALYVLHANALEEAEQLQSKLVARVKPVETIVAPIGPVIATHTGPGVVGVAFYAE